MKLRIGLIASICAAVAVLIACSGGDKPAAGANTPTSGGSGGQTVEVSLKDNEITVAPSEIKPGATTFKVKNDGSKQHQLLLIKTDLPPDGLPVKANDTVNEAEVNVVDRISTFDAGATKELKLTLSAGKYVLICNILEASERAHYDFGENASLLVTQ